MELSRLRIHHCHGSCLGHRYDMDVIPGLGTSVCQEHGGGGEINLDSS